MSTSNTAACTNDTTGHFDIIHVCMYSFIFLVGLVFNLAALVFFFHHIKSRSQTVVYMTNLAIADVLLILTLPVRIYYHLGFKGVPEVLCDCLGLILKANMYGSILFLTCICVDRCMAVSFPMSIRVQGARKKSRLVCLGIWMLTFGASVPIYISKRKNVFSNVTKNCFDNPPVYAIQPAVAFSTLFVGFGIPLVIMVICSWGLIHTVQKSTVAQTNLVDTRKIQRMIATGLLIFLISFSPYHGVLVVLSLHKDSLTSRACGDTQPTQPILTAYRYSLVVACLNSVLNPIAYYFTTDTFRKNMAIGTVKKMFPLYNLSSGQK
ncbi:lysophosphatidic acid receptor 6 [Archocentrus centrarchus]|uniref:lysophosphatidic acid receptor 6 n=1 Tax=Archocentrus centrarchus TaxID=63155 RepID=UPI0011E9F3CB|nr:lysophosphatidic acid receptor 6-like [Archocentrus centrarchus]